MTFLRNCFLEEKLGEKSPAGIKCEGYLTIVCHVLKYLNYCFVFWNWFFKLVDYLSRLLGLLILETAIFTGK